MLRDTAVTAQPSWPGFSAHVPGPAVTADVWVTAGVWAGACSELAAKVAVVAVKNSAKTPARRATETSTLERCRSGPFAIWRRPIWPCPIWPPISEVADTPHDRAKTILPGARPMVRAAGEAQKPNPVTNLRRQAELSNKPARQRPLDCARWTAPAGQRPPDSARWTGPDNLRAPAAGELTKTAGRHTCISSQAWTAPAARR